MCCLRRQDVTYELDGSLFRHEIGVSGTGAGSGEKEPERTKVKKLAVYGNLIFGGFDTARQHRTYNCIRYRDSFH
ncbi:hypothetical protein F2Q68_00033575 [Brassica cretica]|uniref:Uncharacterized protein n=1 Tax=Brassica cretica TaxID=69181 RepID=A0A8S9GX88_BRACR|nr:hypothetical protein F2Q68_00033575 [Brassica cretica]